MPEKYHERLKSPIPREELERRSRALQEVMRKGLTALWPRISHNIWADATGG